jgi:hypothetical protein
MSFFKYLVLVFLKSECFNVLDLIFKKRIYEDYGDDRKKILPWILALSGMTVAAGMVASSKETVWTEAVVDLMPYVVGLWLMTSSLCSCS